MTDPEERETRLKPLDVHVGARIRLRRTMLGFTQERLGDALGLTFQQVQKYERGSNRVSASRLHDLARVLDVPVGFFYDDMPLSEGVGSNTEILGARNMAEEQDGFGGDTTRRRESQDVLRAYFRIVDPAMRKRMLELIRSLATPE